MFFLRDQDVFLKLPNQPINFNSIVGNDSPTPNNLEAIRDHVDLHLNQQKNPNLPSCSNGPSSSINTPPSLDLDTIDNDTIEIEEGEILDEKTSVSVGTILPPPSTFIDDENQSASNPLKALQERFGDKSQKFNPQFEIDFGPYAKMYRIHTLSFDDCRTITELFCQRIVEDLDNLKASDKVNLQNRLAPVILNWFLQPEWVKSGKFFKVAIRSKSAVFLQTNNTANNVNQDIKNISVSPYYFNDFHLWAKSFPIISFAALSG